MARALAAVLLLTSLTFAAPAQTKPRGKSAPAKAAPSKWRGSPILDRVIQQEIEENHIPGAVLIVGHKGKILHRKAYGSRAVEPRREAMTVDTIFDLASLTKVIATTSSIMLLFEEGKIRLNDHVTAYLPGFEGGSSPITVRQLLTHFSGVRPDLDLKLAGADRPWTGYDTGIRLALAEKPTAPPGSRFLYSDINFILLGEIVHRVSGKTLDQFARQRVFGPLKMNNTMFNPPARLRRRIAPTERVDGVPLRGVVHDPTSRAMGGVAGHAGLFSTADDLARFAAMLLGHGRLGGARIFSPLTVEKMTSPQTPPNQPIERGLGWDIESPFASNRGELLPVGSYGHTGFTGTSLWIDPVTQTFIVLLTNRVHPTVRPAPVSLRARVATAVAANLTDVPPELVEKAGLRLTGYNESMYGARRVVYRNGKVLTGLDVLARDQFRILQGKRFGLITNHTGIDRQRRRNIDLMAEAGVKPAVIFSPEHGISGDFDQPDVPDAVDEKTGVHIYSLHQKGRYRPTAEMLRGLDALVFDIQDVGARFYTYMTTMGYCLEEAARRHIPMYVLDRPNPINGIAVEGPILDPTHLSFIGYFPLPLRHAMTAGELARLFNGEKKLGARLEVIKMEGWQRGDWFDETGLPWVDPSPNIRNLYEATVYPGAAMLEGLRNYSVGRGTDTPFEVVGADWIDGVALADYLNARGIPGVRFYGVERTPASSHFAHHRIDGVQILVTERDQVDASEVGLEIAAALIKLFPGHLQLDQTVGLIGSDATVEALAGGEDPRNIRENWRESVEQFRQMREKYLLY
ncbi:MAG TPA: exo-beta-N-acetylmuramidase NamZ domain-containing protein [Bryobacterales bacterium]|nr:exo-beta-N-acetylmuramidase NamZ domain-containing protein [Bryobacterales bacterium]